MNLIPSKCISCGTNMLINAKEHNDPIAHVCATCYGGILSVNDDEKDKLNQEFIDALDNLDDEFEEIDDGWFDESELEKLAKTWSEAMTDNKRTTKSLEEFEDEEIIDNEFEGLEATTPRCECGAKKANTPHATWCPLYSNPMKTARGK